MEGIDIKHHLLVDFYVQNPDKMNLGNYRDFREQRLDIIFKISSNIVNK